MAPKLLLLLVLCAGGVRSATVWETSYEYVMNVGKTIAPSLLSIVQCLGEEQPWACARDRAGGLLDSWTAAVDSQRRAWRESADAEVLSSGRAFSELPSKLGSEIEDSLAGVTDVLQAGLARAFSARKHDSGGIDSITISANSEKKPKKKKQKPAKIQLVQPVMMHKTEDKGRAGAVEGRDLVADAWSIGDKMLDRFAQHALDSDAAEDGVADKSSLEEQRGKKKKKKKAILKLLILGAVLKAKIGTLLQILSFKLQVKFFLIALIGLGINLARFWVELKNKHHQQPQKVIYYEHAQHQHHYDQHDQHEEEEHGWGPWSRSIDPEEQEADDSLPYRAYEKNSQAYAPRPLLTLS
ncbi:uncharacterized protein LOC121738902 [Aricia agestis]|uniref:uncharacterized protein LOC121738902 n=1 Tax=Aricia agestis TaxID=91739 RepID=UPI001C2088B3|nr:uncharacterized protein LOC121738902 [Aricia agestis]